MTAYKERKPNNQKVLLRWMLTVLAMLLLLRLFFWPTMVDGHSMEPTLKDDELLVISKFPLLFDQIERGEIVVLEIEVLKERKRIVKRVIGLPGDHIIITEGALYINGVFQDESYISGVMAETLDYYVAKDMVFVLGDNRTVSEDSRSLGCLSIAAISEVVVIFP